MTALRSFVAALGIALAAIGMGVIAVPGTAGSIALPRIGIVILGAVALVEGARSLATRRRTGLDGADLPDREVRYETGIPGDAFDEAVAALGRMRGPRWTGGESERLRQRLHTAAVEAAANRWRLTTSAARERVETGEWTDDPAAAWFLGGAEVPLPPLPVRVRAALAQASSTGYYANRTAAAVVTLREGP